MQWSVYVDLSRLLGEGEQRAVFEALDARVPDSGCVGPSRSGLTELYFAVEAASAAEAERIAAGLVEALLAGAGVAAGYAISVARLRGPGGRAR